MNFTHEDFQKARRISKAIQEYLESINQEGLRTTDLYPYLARKGVIEKDRHSGVHFRRFLRKLKENDLLHLIPQCQCRATGTEFLEWYFYKAKQEDKNSEPDKKPAKTHFPSISEEEIDELIKKAKPHIEKLPKIDEDKLQPHQKELRKLYPRAYEIWTEKEIKIMHRAFKKFNRVDKVAELLSRQPSVVRKKLGLEDNS